MDVDGAYECLLSARSRFAHWEQRLERDLPGPELKFCKTVLTALAKNVTGLTQRQLLSRLTKVEADPDRCKERLQISLRKLQEEGYITPPDATSRVQFLSFLVRDYWGRNHV